MKDIRKFLPWNYCIKAYATGLSPKGHSQSHVQRVAKGLRRNSEIEQALGEVLVDNLKQELGAFFFIELGVYQLITLGV